MAVSSAAASCSRGSPPVRRGELAAAFAVGADEVGVAEGAGGAGAVAFAARPEITACKPAKYRRAACVGAFALQGLEDFFGGRRRRAERPRAAPALGVSPPLFEDGAEEAAFVADDTARLHGIGVGLLAIGVFQRVLAVGFVGGQAGEGKQRQRDVVRAFRGQEVAVVRAAEPLDQRNPHLRVGFELGDRIGVDDVAQIAGDHGERGLGGGGGGWGACVQGRRIVATRVAVNQRIRARRVAGACLIL
ncbi:hypothetical protein G6F65_011324 [Rhizopus arrhizus]|nr:hypothetical protein G6F65_011324 [Rhizopus arrhizus]